MVTRAQLRKLCRREPVLYYDKNGIDSGFMYSELVCDTEDGFKTTNGGRFLCRACAIAKGLVW